MPPTPIVRLRRLALALPDAHEVEAWGEPTFRVKNKMFATYANAANHHGAGRPSAWIKAAPGNQAMMVKAAPDRFFVPPYVGPSGWIGVYLDEGVVDWGEVGELLADGWRLIAPKRLVAAHEAAPAKKAPTRKAPAKKTTAKKTPAKKAPATKTPAKKVPAKKTPAKQAPAKKAPRRRP